MTYRLNEYLLVPITPDNRGYHVSRSGRSFIEKLNMGRKYIKAEQELSEGRWHLVCKGTEVDEVMAGEMVKSAYIGSMLTSLSGSDILAYQDYNNPNEGLLTALEAYQSYLTANSLTADRIVVLKEV